MSKNNQSKKKGCGSLHPGDGRQGEGVSTKPRRPKRIEPYTRQWERAANEMARAAMTIIACKDCGGAVIEGYCCTRCGASEPS